MCTFEPVYFFGDTPSIKSSQLHHDYDNYGIEVSIVEKEYNFSCNNNQEDSVFIISHEYNHKDSCQCENCSNVTDYLSLYPSTMKDFYYEHGYNEHGYNEYGTGKSNFKVLQELLNQNSVARKENAEKIEKWFDKIYCEKLDNCFDKTYGDKEAKNLALKFMANNMYGSHNSYPSKFGFGYNLHENINKNSAPGQSYEDLCAYIAQKHYPKINDAKEYTIASQSASKNILQELINDEKKKKKEKKLSYKYQSKYYKGKKH